MNAFCHKPFNIYIRFRISYMNIYIEWSVTIWQQSMIFYLVIQIHSRRFTIIHPTWHCTCPISKSILIVFWHGQRYCPEIASLADVWDLQIQKKLFSVSKLQNIVYGIVNSTKSTCKTFLLSPELEIAHSGYTLMEIQNEICIRNNHDWI